MASTFRKTTLIAALALTGAAVPRGAPAFIVYCANCATSATQVTQYAKEVETALNTAKQLETELQQYQNMVTQGKSLGTTQFSSVSGDLSKLDTLYGNSQSLAGQMQNFTTDYASQYKGFDSFLSKAGGDPDALSTYYKTWSDNTSQAAEAAMSAAGANVNQMGDETGRLDALVTQSQSAAGRMQALQAGNQISAMMVQQLQKMRAMVNDQVQAQGLYEAQQAAALASRQAADQHALSGTYGPASTAGF